MRAQAEIVAMIARLEGDIWAQGWDPSLDAASKALAWALGDTPTDLEALVRNWVDRPEADRRREWIARGGDPDLWPTDANVVALSAPGAWEAER